MTIEDECDRLRTLGAKAGAYTASKHKAYGSAYQTGADFLRLLAPEGVKPELYLDAILATRIVEKIKRLFTDPSAFGESPWVDIVGHALCGALHAGADLNGVELPAEEARTLLCRYLYSADPRDQTDAAEALRLLGGPPDDPEPGPSALVCPLCERAGGLELRAGGEHYDCGLCLGTVRARVVAEKNSTAATHETGPVISRAAYAALAERALGALDPGDSSAVAAARWHPSARGVELMGGAETMARVVAALDRAGLGHGAPTAGGRAVVVLPEPDAAAASPAPRDPFRGVPYATPDSIARHRPPRIGALPASAFYAWADVAQPETCPAGFQSVGSDSPLASGACCLPLGHRGLHATPDRRAFSVPPDVTVPPPCPSTSGGGRHACCREAGHPDGHVSADRLAAWGRWDDDGAAAAPTPPGPTAPGGCGALGRWESGAPRCPLPAGHPEGCRLVDEPTAGREK